MDPWFLFGFALIVVFGFICPEGHPKFIFGLNSVAKSYVQTLSYLDPTQVAFVQMN